MRFTQAPRLQLECMASNTLCSTGWKFPCSEGVHNRNTCICHLHLQCEVPSLPVSAVMRRIKYNIMQYSSQFQCFCGYWWQTLGNLSPTFDSWPEPTPSKNWKSATTWMVHVSLSPEAACVKDRQTGWIVQLSHYTMDVQANITCRWMYIYLSSS